MLDYSVETQQLNHLLSADTSWFTQELENTPEFLNECLESKGLLAWEFELEKKKDNILELKHCAVIIIGGGLLR